MEIIEGYDVIVDGADNFPTRYLLNDASVRRGSRWSRRRSSASTGSSRSSRRTRAPATAASIPRRRRPSSPRLRRERRARRAAGTMGLLQATEVIKLIVGAGEPLVGRLLLYEALSETFTELKVKRDPDCPICSRDPGCDLRGRDGQVPRLRGLLRRGMG